LSADKTTRIWDANTGKLMGEPLRHAPAVYAANLSADGARIVTLSNDKTAQIWDTKSGLPVGEPLRHEGVVNAANFSADGTRMPPCPLTKRRASGTWTLANRWANHCASRPQSFGELQPGRRTRCHRIG
jgi:WD40 repeat protein